MLNWFRSKATYGGYSSLQCQLCCDPNFITERDKKKRRLLKRVVGASNRIERQVLELLQFLLLSLLFSAPL